MNYRKIIPSLLTAVVAVSFLLVLFVVLAFYHSQSLGRGDAGAVPPVEVQAELPPEMQQGMALFKNNCANCHHKDMNSKLVGPALAGVTERWKDYPRKDLYRWIRSSQALIQEKHPKAEELWKVWQPSVMNDFPNLKDEDIEALLAYIER